MFMRLAPICASVALMTTPVAASPATELLSAMGVERIIELMRAEGIEYGDEIAEDLLPSGPTASWQATVSRIYDTDAMHEVVEAGFVEALGDADVNPLLDFFTSERGEKLVALELSAREAMMDEAVEDSAREAYRTLEAEDDPRLELVSEFVDANDLIEANVVGALNSSFMFYRGLVDGGAFQMSEEDILTEVWHQEAETRLDTREWVYGFLLMAYGPLEDETLRSYVELSRTEAGRAMNRALFAGFDQMYGDISYALGLASARQMQGQDL